MTRGEPTVAAVLVNYRAPELVTTRVGALADDGIGCIVADNSGELQDAPFRVVDCGGNIGFGAACNRAVAALDAEVDVVCLHNPDVVATGDDIRRLARTLSAGVGAVAPALRTAGVVRREGFHYPSVAREAYVAARALRTVGAPRRAPTSPTPRAARAAGRRFGSGALLVVDRAAFSAVQGFDERYFLYGEDLDLWQRLTIAGYRNRFASNVIVDHVGKGGSEMATPMRELLRWLGVELFAESRTRLGWRAYRVVHRRLLDRLPDVGALGACVRESWDAGARPSMVLASVRELFSAEPMRSPADPASTRA